MSEKTTGRLVVAFVGLSVLVLLGLNLNLKGRGPSARAVDDSKVPSPGSGETGTLAATSGIATEKPAGFREYPIGDEAVRNEIRIAAVWLPPVQMEGMPEQAPDLLHVEADIHAIEGNPNGFAKDEFVPYLKIRYEIRRADDSADKPALASGPMMPMIARDGMHYGANISMPESGSYKLTYHIEPPSAGGLGRHADSATGVAPWWKPFDVSFDWDYAGPPKPGA